jgi:hypothetical protein
MSKLVLNYARSSGKHPRIKCDRTVFSKSILCYFTYVIVSMFIYWRQTLFVACFKACHNAYSKCHVTSNKAKSNLECAEDKFQTRGWIRGSFKVEERVLRKLSHNKLCA